MYLGENLRSLKHLDFPGRSTGKELKFCWLSLSYGLYQIEVLTGFLSEDGKSLLEGGRADQGEQEEQGRLDLGSMLILHLGC